MAEQYSCALPGGGQRHPQPVAALALNEAAIEKLSAIQATGNNLRVTQTMQFKTEAPVIWSVNGIPGGNADIGTISSAGLYTAPAIVPLPNNQVTIGSSAEIYPFQGKLRRCRPQSNPHRDHHYAGSFFRGHGADCSERIGLCLRRANSVEWRAGSDHLSIGHTTCGHGDGIHARHLPGYGGQPRSWFGVLQKVNALVQPGQVVIQLQPSETSVRVNNTITITPTVTGSQDTALTWTVNGIPGGNAQIGTINARAFIPRPQLCPTQTWLWCKQPVSTIPTQSPS